ncbi:NAD(+)/NADH kinase [Pajaroellobacter abortibovis]|uniref:NAD(+) kinase n=1 Tax=Pajaroellobacter abortibovis TaxID=1882918 RepID=A0A1L6MXL4_9BACT|nr:NAD(+)/NADH kinase [Pajaroellobacter abortibovis]APS00323.1 hypothetical protein BCY86_06265 [Pajaroellobacter abortibovis]
MRSYKVAVILKRSEYYLHVEQEHDPHVQDLIERDDPIVRSMCSAHEEHQGTIQEVLDALKKENVSFQIFESSSSLDENTFDLYITVGGDGTLLAASHVIGPHAVVLGINSAPTYSVGFFCAGRKGTLSQTIHAALTGSLPQVRLTRMSVSLNDQCIHRRVLNELLFCHACPAATSHYLLRTLHQKQIVQEEEQRSSGLWVGPAAGSTAAQKSAGGQILPLTSPQLQYVVREPYTPLGGSFTMRTGLFSEDEELLILNEMKQGKIFIDGHHVAFDTTIGDAIALSLSPEPLTILGPIPITRDNKTHPL